MPKTESKHIRLPAEIHQKVKMEAFYQGRTITKYLQNLVESDLKRKKKIMHNKRTSRV